MSYPQRVPVHHPQQHGMTDSPASTHTNPRFQHQYSELLQLGATDSDGSATYTMPAYGGSDGSHTTYSTTAPLYHNPNCQCHLQPSQPAQCLSPANQSARSAESTDSNITTASDAKTDWNTRGKEKLTVNRLKQPIAWIWMSLSLFLFALSTLTLTQTGWLVNSRTSESLGLIKQCKRNEITNDLNCQQYARLASISWRLTLIFFCLADTLLGLSWILALSTITLIQKKARRRISFLAGYMQLFAAVLFTTAIMFYMVGLDSKVVREICGTNSSIFRTGDCDVGWSYLLLTITSSLCFLLPVLSHYIDYTLCNKPERRRDSEYITT